MAIMRLQLIAVVLEQALSIKFFGNQRPLIERRPALLNGHLEEQQKRQVLGLLKAHRIKLTQGSCNELIAFAWIEEIANMFTQVA